MPYIWRCQISYNGSGTFLINSAGQPVVPGTTITTTAFNALTADLASGLTTAMTKDGQTVPTANIPMGGFKLTGLGAGTSATDAAQFGQLQNAPVATLITVAGADTITGTLVQTLTAYATGQQFSFVAAGTNTTAVTLNIDGLGAKAVTRTGAVALAAGALVSGQMAIVEYDGTRFQLINANAFTNLTVSGALTVGTTLAVTGVATLTAQPILSSLTASLPVFSDASKGLVSNAMTGSGSVVMSASPTLTGTIGAASQTLSGSLTVGTTLGVTGTSTMAAINASGVVSIGVTKKWFTFEDGSGNYLSNTASGGGQGIYASATQILLFVGGSSVLTGVAAGVTIPGTLGVTGLITGNGGFTGSTGIFAATNSLATVTIQTAGLADGYSSLALKNSGGDGIVAISRSAGGDIFTGSTQYALNVGTMNAFPLMLGTNGVTRLTISSAGAVSIPYVWANTGGTTAVMVDSAGTLFKLASARKYKMDIAPYTKGLADVLKLDPQYYRVKSQGADSHMYAGLIADDLDAQGLSEFVAYGPEGVDSINYGHMAALFTNAIKELAADFQSYKSSHP